MGVSPGKVRWCSPEASRNYCDGVWWVEHTLYNTKNCTHCTLHCIVCSLTWVQHTGFSRNVLGGGGERQNKHCTHCTLHCIVCSLTHYTHIIAVGTVSLWLEQTIIDVCTDHTCMYEQWKYIQAANRRCHSNMLSCLTAMNMTLHNTIHAFALGWKPTRSLAFTSNVMLNLFFQLN